MQNLSLGLHNELPYLELAFRTNFSSHTCIDKLFAIKDEEGRNSSHAWWHRNDRNGEEKEKERAGAGGKRICVAGSMRVVPSGVWRRAFVRSCVSLLVTEAAPI